MPSKNSQNLEKKCESAITGSISETASLNGAVGVACTKTRILVAGDSTLSTVCRSLQKALGEPFEILEAGYNTWQREIVDPSSDFSTIKPDMMVFLLSPRILSDLSNVESSINQVIDQLHNLDGKTHVVFSLVTVDPDIAQPTLNTIDLQKLANRINERLFQFEETKSWFSIFDLQSVFNRLGTQILLDSRFEAIGRMVFSPKGAMQLAPLLARTLKAAVNTPKKVLVLDLDNTVWGGILGEDGFDGIKMSGEGTGYAHMRFQKEVIRLKQNGILLAVCSKNNEADALNVFHTHPDIQIKLTDLAAYRINWNPKSENIREMANELNLGVDSFVFFDDSEFERSQMIQMLPKVTVIDVPKEASDFVKTLTASTAFDTLKVTADDRKRAKQYQEEAKRNSLKRESLNLEEFYRSLEMKAELTQANEGQIARVHQLIHKTNQFNLTTKRINDAELRSLVSDRNSLVLTLRLTDKWGESGLTGVVLVTKRNDDWKIDNLMLSCRIIGRTVEFGLIHEIAKAAKKDKAKAIFAQFVRSERNQVAEKFLPEAGFVRVDDFNWKLDLSEFESLVPKHYVDFKSDLKKADL